MKMSTLEAIILDLRVVRQVRLRLNLRILALFACAGSDALN
jgi:hypothetical protein